MEKQYDVSLSFAGEDRPYVSQVAEYIRNRGFRVFYDSFFEIDLWGKNLIEELDRIYRHESKFVIIFISKSYVEKEWTKIERRSALSAALSSSSEYVLPVRFDDTDMIGLPPSIAYKDARNISAEKLAEMIISKLGGTNAKTILPDGMTAWRITNKHYSSDLLGEGAKLFGGLWNNKGTPVLYCATSYCVAFSESILRNNVGLRDNAYLENMAVARIFIPTGTSIETVYEHSLPVGWRDFNQDEHITTKKIGSDWVHSISSCVLSVPSRLMPYERYLLLNPLHPEFDNVKISAIEPLYPINYY